MREMFLNVSHIFKAVLYIQIHNQGFPESKHPEIIEMLGFGVPGSKIEKLCDKNGPEWYYRAFKLMISKKLPYKWPNKSKTSPIFSP